MTSDLEKPEQRVTRAFRIALLGSITCPGPAHLWSYLLLSKMDTETLSARSRRIRRITQGLDLVVMVVAAFVAAAVLVQGLGGPPPEGRDQTDTVGAEPD